MTKHAANDLPDTISTDLTRAYERMLARIREQLSEAEASAPLPIYMVIEEARERAVSLGEMTQAEASQVAYWLKRDLLHLRDVISRSEQGFMNWLGLDLKLIEQGLLDILADPTRVDWLHLQQEFEALRENSGTKPKKRKSKSSKSQNPQR